ncbi:MAG: L-glutamate gamma-semialdehyde dehydrogenase, partial [Bacteroidota bacterium]
MHLTLLKIKTMPKGIYRIPAPVNEPVRAYAPGHPETKRLLDTYQAMYNNHLEVPLYIGNEKIKTNQTLSLRPPHEHGKEIGVAYVGDASHVHKAIESALAAKEKWANLPWEHRAAIFLRAAELLAGPYRDRMNAATMLAQSKNVMQAEIDAACELIDFFRFNAAYMQQIYADQPGSQPGMWNRLEYRPLEGFVFAVTPFNFTS